MSDNGIFTIISITGAHSSVGKTTLASILLERLEGFGAIKFTKTPLYTSVTDETGVIMENGKDTAVMARSGAEKVVWIQTQTSELEDPLAIAMSKMSGLRGVVIEGNSPVDFINPHLVIFIVGQDGQIKPTAQKVREKADIIIVNSADHTQNPFISETAQDKNRQTFWIDLINRTGDIDKFLAYTKQYISTLQ